MPTYTIERGLEILIMRYLAGENGFSFDSTSFLVRIQGVGQNSHCEN